jgi:DNA polymerase-3 subunit epsilon
MCYDAVKEESLLMFQWRLERALAVFDTEATGTNPLTDRIVEICIVKIRPSGERQVHEFRINPQVPIPAGATEIHGITDADVADCPPFHVLARQIADILADCDLGGFNLIRYDIPLLASEFFRSNVPFSLEGRRIIDAQRIFHRREPRDLTAALRFYCNELHLEAHGAKADALATVRVLEGQFEKYPDLPRDLSQLDEYCSPRDPDWVDRAGRLKWSNGEVVINFGKKAGQPLRLLVESDRSFLKWILKAEFPADTQEIIRNAMQGKYPEPPPSSAEETTDPNPVDNVEGPGKDG